MFRPVTRKYKNLYDIEPYKGSNDLVETMKRAPLGVISAAVVFFYRLGSELLTDSLASLRAMERETETIVGRDNLRLSTVGLIRSMLYPEGTSLDLTPLQNKTFSQLYSTSSTPKENQN